MELLEDAGSATCSKKGEPEPRGFEKVIVHKQKDTRLSVLLFYRNVMDKGAYLESVLDEKVDVWYNEDNDETSERTQYEEDPVYLPRQYPKKPRNSLLYQCFSSLERRLLHHNYTICERALM